MSVRDTGWIQIFVENGQEVIDNILCAFRIGEDHRVLLPVMIHLDGFYLTHVIEPILLPEQSKVDKFIPPNQYPLPLDAARPESMGCLAPPTLYPEIKSAQDTNLREAKKVILQCWQDFGKSFGHHYSPVECYHCEDAEVLLLTMGSFSETASIAIDKMRQEGKSVGQLRLRLWRPFPFEEIRKAVKNAKVLITLDRALSFGGPGGPVCSEVKAALYEDKRPKVIGFVGGLGGRDITIAGFEEIVNKGIEISKKGSKKEFEIFGVRE
jgi:pyruvate ferredoxin oxidoreductase alpha subunit